MRWIVEFTRTKYIFFFRLVLKLNIPKIFSLFNFIYWQLWQSRALIKNYTKSLKANAVKCILMPDNIAIVCIMDPTKQTLPFLSNNVMLKHIIYLSIIHNLFY